jgi:hypothetical protein
MRVVLHRWSPPGKEACNVAWERRGRAAEHEMRCFVLIVAGWSFAAGAAHSATRDNLQPSQPESIQGFESGYSLLESCGNPAQRAYCIGYAVGVIDAYNALAGTRADRSLRICLPKGVRKSEAGAAVAKYLADNPDSLNFDAASLSFKALVKAFPCE